MQNKEAALKAKEEELNRREKALDEREAQLGLLQQQLEQQSRQISQTHAQQPMDSDNEPMDIQTAETQPVAMRIPIPSSTSARPSNVTSFAPTSAGFYIHCDSTKQNAPSQPTSVKSNVATATLDAMKKKAQDILNVRPASLRQPSMTDMQQQQLEKENQAFKPTTDGFLFQQPPQRRVGLKERPINVQNQHVLLEPNDENGEGMMSPLKKPRTKSSMLDQRTNKPSQIQPQVDVNKRHPFSFVNVMNANEPPPPSGGSNVTQNLFGANFATQAAARYVNARVPPPPPM